MNSHQINMRKDINNDMILKLDDINDAVYHILSPENTAWKLSDKKLREMLQVSWIWL